MGYEFWFERQEVRAWGLSKRSWVRENAYLSAEAFPQAETLA